MSTPAATPSELVLSPGERVLLARRPSAWLIVLAHAGWYVMMLLALAAAWSGSRTFLADYWGLLLGLWWLAVLLRLAWDTLDWFSRRYVLTDLRMVAVGGVLRRGMADLPLDNMQYLALDRSVRQRVVGVGTIAAGTSGRAMAEVVWAYVPAPQAVLAQVRAAMEAAGGKRHSPPPPTGSRPLVVGLVGGIGSGKSTVAAELAAGGCVVVDSDKAAKEILTRPDVRDTLVEWWGPEILDGSGVVDRRRIASIVFADAAQRTRLEALVHPLIKQERDQTIARVGALAASVGESTGGMVCVDAPLLFEAGVDRECDAVVFVEAPREARLERVKSRGWDEGELGRREAAQMPLEEKRRRAGLVIVNDGDLAQLRARAAALLEELRRMARERRDPGVRRD